MKRASTQANDEAILEAMVAPRSRSYLRVEWDDAGAWRALEDLDVENDTEWGEEVEKKQYSSFSLTPQSNTASLKVINIQARYSETSGTDYSTILRPNRKIRISGGYEVTDPVQERYEFPLGIGVIKNGLMIDSLGRLALNISNTDDDPAPYLTDFWNNKYGSSLYGAAKYAPAGYWVGTLDLQSIGKSSEFNKISVTANNANVRVFYRTFTDRSVFEAANTTSASWVEVGNSVNGTADFVISSAGERYIQVALVPDGTTWASGDIISAVSVEYLSQIEFIYRSVFYLDTPKFPEPPHPETPKVNCTMRDVWRRAVEIPAILPDVDTLYLHEVVKLVCDQVGIKYTATSISDLTALGARTLSTWNDKPVKIDEVIDWIAQTCTQLDGTAKIRYKVFLKYDDALRDQVLYIQPRALDYEALFVFQSRYYLELGDRSRNNDKKLYRITVCTKKENVSAETVLDSEVVAAPGTVTLSWTGTRVYKRVRLSAVTGTPSISITAVTNTSITLAVTGSFTTLTLTASGCAYSSTVPDAVGEWLRVEADGEISGQGIEIENRLLLDDAEAARIANGFGDEYGEPVNTATDLVYPYLHLTPEANDMVGLWARFIFDDNLYRIKGRRYYWNYIAGGTSFDLEDTGLNFSDISQFKYDEDPIVQEYDMGLLYDMSFGPQGLEDPQSYEDLRDIQFTEIPIAPGLVFWNKCEAESGGIIPSVKGPSISKGAATFRPAVFGNGEINLGGAYTSILSSDFQSLLAEPRIGCIEFWIVAGVDFSLVGNNQIVGHVTAANSSGEGILMIGNTDGSVGVQVVVLGALLPLFALPIVVGNNYHIAITWDFINMIGGSDTIRVYVDGVMVASTSDPNVYSSWIDCDMAFGRQWPGALQLGATYDNIKIWDYAKTDFSDRFAE